MIRIKQNWQTVHDTGGEKEEESLLGDSGKGRPLDAGKQTIQDIPVPNSPLWLFPSHFVRLFELTQNISVIAQLSISQKESQNQAAHPQSWPLCWTAKSFHCLCLRPSVYPWAHHLLPFICPFTLGCKNNLRGGSSPCVTDVSEIETAYSTTTSAQL